MQRTLRATLLLLAGCVCPCAATTAASQTVLSDSVAPVAPAPVPTAPHRAYVSRATLKSSEQTETQDFEVALKMRNFADLQARVAKGEIIPLAEMKAKYQPLPADYQKVVDWLVQQGFTIDYQDPNHLAVFASGTVDRIGNKLSLRFARVKKDGTEYTSAVSAPVVPNDVGGLLVGINGLQPHLHMHPHSVASTSGAGAPFEPGQLAEAYNATNLYNYNITGTGQTIAIIIDTFPLQSDLNTFWSDFGVTRTGTVSFIEAVTPRNGGSLPATSAEDSLDTEITSSIAPGANIRVYACNTLGQSNLDKGYAKVYSDITSTPSLNIYEMTMSYGAPESEEPTSVLTTEDQYYSEIAAAGVTIFASTGDDGATAGTGSLTPETPSSDPNVSAVGGTSLNVNSQGAETSEVVWNNSIGATGGGISTYFALPSWQRGTGVNTSDKRQVPDISSDGDPDTGVYVIISGQTYVYGGTSLSSPMWAGFAALINQARANNSLGAIGPLNPSLYPLIGTSNFRDITSGNNAYESSLGYNAGVGFDLCTGCGVPNVTELAMTLSNSTTLAPDLSSVVSVQSHAGTDYSIALPLTGTPGVECRQVNGDLQLVFTFVQPVVSGDADVTDGTGDVDDVSFSGDTMTVDLSGVTNAQEITVEVSNINGTTGSDSVTLGVLLGDINGDGAVNAQDVTLDRNAVESVGGTNGFNCKTDLNLDGAVNAQDVTLTRNAVESYIPDF